MSLKDALTEHANVLRSKTGVSDTLSISDMTRLLGDLSWGKENLLTGTSDTYSHISDSGWSPNNMYGRVKVANSMIGKNYTYAVMVKNDYGNKLRIVAYCLKNGQKLTVNLGKDIANLGDEKQIYVTFPVASDADSLQVNVEAINGNANTVSYSYKDESVYEGTEPGIWTPNPSDLTGGVELVILQVLCFLSTLIDWRWQHDSK